MVEAVAEGAEREHPTPPRHEECERGEREVVRLGWHL